MKSQAKKQMSLTIGTSSVFFLKYIKIGLQNHEGYNNSILYKEKSVFVSIEATCIIIPPQIIKATDLESGAPGQPLAHHLQELGEQMAQWPYISRAHDCV